MGGDILDKAVKKIAKSQLIIGNIQPFLYLIALDDQPISSFFLRLGGFAFAPAVGQCYLSDPAAGFFVEVKGSFAFRPFFSRSLPSGHKFSDRTPGYLSLSPGFCRTRDEAIVTHPQAPKVWPGVTNIVGTRNHPKCL